jgi:hypothetical protein
MANGHGGRRPGAGRPLDWLKEQTRDIIRKDKLVERLAKIASGQDIEQPISNGEVISVPAPVAEQRKAILDLIERGFGKPEQTVEMNLNAEGERPSAEELVELRRSLVGDRQGTKVAKGK